MSTERRRNAGRAQVCIAEMQNAGRGRRGRSWVAPFGSGICMSIGWQFAEAPPTFSALSLAVGVAAVKALRRFGIADVGLEMAERPDLAEPQARRNPDRDARRVGRPGACRDRHRHQHADARGSAPGAGRTAGRADRRRARDPARANADAKCAVAARLPRRSSGCCRPSPSAASSLSSMNGAARYAGQRTGEGDQRHARPRRHGARRRDRRHACWSTSTDSCGDSSRAKSVCEQRRTAHDSAHRHRQHAHQVGDARQAGARHRSQPRSHAGWQRSS